jgi:hypothetical protein
MLQSLVEHVEPIVLTGQRQPPCLILFPTLQSLVEQVEPIVLTGKAWTAMLHLCKELVDIQQSYIHTQVHSFLLIEVFKALQENRTQYFFNMIYTDLNLGTQILAICTKRYRYYQAPKSLSYIVNGSLLQKFHSIETRSYLNKSEYIIP